MPALLSSEVRVLLEVENRRGATGGLPYREIESEYVASESREDESGMDAPHCSLLLPQRL